MQKSLLILAAALVATPAFAGVTGSNPANAYLNEIYASHDGTDDFEMIELVGTPNASLDGYVVCIVEGDSSSSTGILDRAWDLSGMTMPADGYFVLGDTAEPNKDFDIGASNRIENGTDTFYLIHASAPGAITALLSTHVETSATTTSLPSLGTVVDCVGGGDGGYAGGGDTVFDCCEVVGPDGSFLPAGWYRTGDYPGKWSTSYLDFDDVANTDDPRTPGSANGTNAVTTYGAVKCQSSTGRMQLAVSGDTTSGTGAITIDILNGPTNGGAGGALCGLFIGLGEANVPLSGGCSFLVQPSLQLFLPLDANGDLPIGPIGIPGGFTGLVIYMQSVSSESGSFVESNGICMEIL